MNSTEHDGASDGLIADADFTRAIDHLLERCGLSSGPITAGALGERILRAAQRAAREHQERTQDRSECASTGEAAADAVSGGGGA